MTDSYSLTVVNESPMADPTFAVVASIPTTGGIEALSTAWQTEVVPGHEQHRFGWQMEWQFAWSTAQVMPGGDWPLAGTLDADPNSPNGCEADLTYAGGFNLTPGRGNPDGRTLWIEDEDFPYGQGEPSVGLTLGGDPVVAVGAMPNMRQAFTVQPRYYVGVGDDLGRGELLDGSTVAGFQSLDFNGGTALTATLHPDNTWTVQPSP